jgi:xylan 1,4-beta-xylosidase
MAIFAAPVHDEKYSAAFVLKSVLDLNNQFAGYFFWCLSDLFEEQIQLNKPFIGGFGIMTNDGIPKPSFWAFKLLSKLYSERLDIGFRAFGDVEYAAFRNGSSIQVVVYTQSNDPNKNERHDVEIEIDGIAVSGQVERIDDDHCNPKKLWLEMGSPQNLTPKQVDRIKDESKLKVETAEFEVRNGKTILHSVLQTNDIALYTIELEG